MDMLSPDELEVWIKKEYLALSGKALTGEYGDFWYPDVNAGAQGIKWLEKCVESADNGSIWVDF